MLEFCQLSQQEYDAFQKVHPYRNFMNTVKAMEVKLHNGWAVEYVGVKKDGSVVAEGTNVYRQCEVSDWNLLVSDRE